MWPPQSPVHPPRRTRDRGTLIVVGRKRRNLAHPPLVQGCLLSIGLTYVLVNLLTDAVNRFVNPRMRWL